MIDPCTLAELNVPADTLVAYGAALNALLEELLLDARAPDATTEPHVELVDDVFEIVAQPGSRLAKSLARDGTDMRLRTGGGVIGRALALYTDRDVLAGMAAWARLAPRFWELRELVPGVVCTQTDGRVRATLQWSEPEPDVDWATAARAPSASRTSKRTG